MLRQDQTKTYSWQGNWHWNLTTLVGKITNYSHFEPWKYNMASIILAMGTYIGMGKAKVVLFILWRQFKLDKNNKNTDSILQSNLHAAILNTVTCVLVHIWTRTSFILVSWLIQGVTLSLIEEQSKHEQSQNCPASLHSHTFGTIFSYAAWQTSKK